MAWNKAAPAGLSGLNLGDDTIRENQAALEDALVLEHDFATAGTQTGRHRFGLGDLAARDTAHAAKAFVDGGVWLRDDLDPFGGTRINFQFRAGAAWVDQPPPVYPDLPVQRSAAEWGSVASLSVAAGLIAWDWEASQSAKVTLTADATLSNPTGPNIGLPTPANVWGTWLLKVTQDGTGGRSLAYGSLFRGGYDGEVMAVAQAAGAVSLVYCTLVDDVILVNVLPGLAAL